ncbi:hypothetical protein LR48_Vigan04g178100 [Vigna angularis]|uniref:Uncharacterized protein n=1 Tax=Phaseolus angularis TaxID=3914 RepID=A0A0L9UFS8_PHAAN|nr:hypothetical protein LR48_Vigan04g178100 [Vigna angularis]
MGVESVAPSPPPPRSEGNTALLQNPNIPFALALLFADAVLVTLIITFVPCKFQFPLCLDLQPCNRKLLLNVGGKLTPKRGSMIPKLRLHFTGRLMKMPSENPKGYFRECCPQLDWQLLLVWAMVEQ